MKFSLKNTSRLESGQIDHNFVALRKIGQDHPAPSEQDYKEFLAAQKQVVLDSDIGETMKARIVGKIDKAIEDDQIPSGSTYYALTHMNDRATKTWRTLATKLREHANETGITPSAAMRQFRGLYASTVSPRSGDVDYGNTLDPKTLAVLSKMKEGYEPRFEETPRITRQSTGMKTIVAQGYDPEDGRLEVEYFNGSVYAFHSVSPEDYEKFKESPVAVFNQLRMSTDHQYESKQEADRDANRVWCDKCHRYRLASGHVCEDGNVSGAVVGASRKKNVDDVYKKVRDAYSSNQPSASESPMVTPVWAKPADERTHADLPAEAYGERQGSQGRTPSGAKAITVDKDALLEQVRAGNVVTMNLGRKIAVSGSDRTEYYEATVPVTAQMVNGNHHIKFTPDYRNAKCTCEAYQANGRCKHLYPTEGSDRLNRFVESDIQGSLRDFGDYVRPSWASNDEFHFSTNGETNADGSRSLSDDDLEQIRYALSQTDRASVVVHYDDQGYSAATILTVNEAGTVNSGAGDRYTRAYAAQVQDKLNGTNFVAARLARNAENIVGEGWEMESESRQEYLARFRNRTENGYLENPDKFVADYKAAQAAADQPLPFTTGAVTGGYLSTGPGPGARGFGVEIEFDSASSYEIAEALYDAGLTEADEVEDYHQSSDYSRWKVEDDCSVAGEIVSPILYDNEESWEQVRKVCEIAKRHGARASIRTGSHVHIGAGNMTTDQRRGVFAATAAHQDVVRRISTDPSRGTHRTSGGSNHYSAAFSSNDVTQVYESRRGGMYLDRYRMVNFENDNTIEFRDPDGSLDPGHIQAQVMMASALMAAGESGEWDNLTTGTVRRQRVGANAARQPYVDNAVTDEDDRIIAGNISLMTSLDSLFPDAEARQRMVQVAARVPWQASERSYY